MTATEDLRRLLDERGVKYETDDTSDSWYERTTWSSENNLWWTYEVDTIEELPYGTLTLLDTGSNNSMRPAQAIAATLGPEECHNVHEPPKNTTFWPCPHFKCSECGEVYVSMQYVFYCPNCGRKVADW